MNGKIDRMYGIKRAPNGTPLLDRVLAGVEDKARQAKARIEIVRPIATFLNTESAYTVLGDYLDAHSALEDRLFDLYWYRAHVGAVKRQDARQDARQG